MIRFLVAGIAFLTAVSSNAFAEDKFDALFSLNNPDHILHQSEILERPFHIFVRLPHGYDESDENYPVVYLLDGGSTFPMLGAYYHYLSFFDEVPDAILVGVGYPGATFEEGNFRGRDFTAPSTEPDFRGGAETFHQVFETEFFPLIEGKYHADPERRVIFGHSLGGQFALFSALTRPDLFWGHIASNPALHRNLPLFLSFDFDGAEQTNARVFAASGSNDDERFRVPALEWFDHWSDEKTPKPWALKTVTLEGHTHMSLPPAAFRDGMAWLFAEE